MFWLYVDEKLSERVRIPYKPDDLKVKKVQSVERIEEHFKQTPQKKYQNQQSHDHFTKQNALSIMQSPVVTCSPEDSLNKISHIFLKKSIRHLPVINAIGEVVAIISDRDILATRDRTKQVKTLMQKKVLACDSQSSLQEILRTMLLHHIGCLPVLDKSQKLIGIITRSDLLRHFIYISRFDIWA